MKEQNIAKAYAKSIIQLTEKDNIDVASELTKLTEMINSSNDLETVLFLEVFTMEEKNSVLDPIASNLGLSKIVVNFLKFLIQEKRIGLFPMIFKEVIVIDDDNKGFLRGVIEGAEDAPSDSEVAKVTKYLEEKLGKKAHLEYRKSDTVTAGLRVTVDDLQLDATIDNQLNKFKQSVLNS